MRIRAYMHVYMTAGICAKFIAKVFQLNLFSKHSSVLVRMTLLIVCDYSGFMSASMKMC